MLKIQKIADTSLNMDVQGQGCWDDCYIGAHWENQSNSTQTGCIFYSPYWTLQKNFFS